LDMGIYFALMSLSDQIAAQRSEAIVSYETF
jgi:hypothetical protein